MPAALTGLRESCLYVDDLERAKRFYTGLFEAPVLAENAHFCALDIAGSAVLLLFLRGGSAAPAHMKGGTIPPHDGAGPVHIGFGIERADFAVWEQHLAERGIGVESYVDWPRGGRSIYLRDPDGHLVELLTRGVWTTY